MQIILYNQEDYMHKQLFIPPHIYNTQCICYIYQDIKYIYKFILYSFYDI